MDRSGTSKLDVLECEYFGELVEVGVVMELRDATVFSSGCGRPNTTRPDRQT
jgi:hypothetical protein